MGHRARPTGSHPVTMRRERTLNLRCLDDLSRRKALDGLQPLQVGKRHDRRLLAPKTDHLIPVTRIRNCWLRCHASHHNGTRRRSGATIQAPANPTARGPRDSLMIGLGECNRHAVRIRDLHVADTVRISLDRFMFDTSGT